MVSRFCRGVLRFWSEEAILDKIIGEIPVAPNRVRYTMNGFVISLGCDIQPLAERAKQVARQLGTVRVEVGQTDCKVPLASASIEKVEAAGRLGKKRAIIRC